MKYYKFVGSKEQASDYASPQPIIGRLYSSVANIGKYPVSHWLDIYSYEWEEVVEEEVMVNIDDFKDKVNHPAHYNQGDVECIEAIKSATINKKGIEAVCVGNVIKYLWRYEGKGEPLEDVKKAKRYLEMLIENLKTK